MSDLQPGIGTYSTRIPVKAGDAIGVDDDTGAKLSATGVTTTVYSFSPVLTSFPTLPSPHPDRELLVNADIEHDADGDGYGDETQDLCPGDETRHTACLSNLSISMKPEPAPLTVGRPLTYTI